MVFRIGEFSRIARVSCRLLRYYDEIGLLKPAHISHENGYRYYRATQIPTLNRILVLKDLGFGLEQIGRVLEDPLHVDELRGMLKMRRLEIARSIEAQTDRLRQIETRLNQIETEGQSSLEDVLIRQEPARRFLSIRKTMPDMSAGIAFVGQLVKDVPAIIGKEALLQFAVFAHGEVFEHEEIDAEFGFFLQTDREESLDLPGGLVLNVREVPPVPKMVTSVRVGSPHDAHGTTAKIGAFMEASGLKMAGPNREVFLKMPRMDRIQESVVEMQFPVESTGSN